MKLAGAAKSIVAARFFGAGNALDCYLVAFLVPSFLADVFAGAMNPTVVPRLIEAEEHEGKEGFQAVYAHAFYRVLVLLSTGALLVFAGSHFVIRILASGFTESKISETQALMAVMLPIMPLSAVCVVWRSVLNAKGRFIAAAISPVLTPVILVVSLLLFANRYGLYTLGVGTAAGCTAEAMLAAIALRSAKIAIVPSWTLAQRTCPELLQQYASVVASNLALGGVVVVNQAMAAMLGPGSVSVFTLASRMVGVLLVLGPTALIVAMLPRLGKMTALQQWSSLKRTVCQSLLISMSIVTAVSIVLSIISKPIVKYLFQSHNFTYADILAVASLQSLLAFQLPFAVCVGILMRVLVLLKLRKALVGVSGMSVLLSVALNQLLMKHYGLNGIAVATILVQGVMAIVLTHLVFRYLHRGGETNSILMERTDSKTCKSFVNTA